jgi:HSP20 family molecular chaperone IbpA
MPPSSTCRWSTRPSACRARGSLPRKRGASYHRKEGAEGAFSRSGALPAPFDGARVDAKDVDGILTLTLPKPEAAKPRRVTVQTS